ncbi:carbohydrate ABC transporter permease [Priestia megaterium]|jgi:raffinose/stachyose/melibiose transport system permease protein|uniref:Raffinose/stachyose/melibiose transport system permease protein n=2 Tax=Priestia TaxID=2800373 RepID=A0A7W3REF9_PRIAR|nr:MULTISPECIES: carbohydrate ABC transporter permease [Priestia]AVX08439.1 carbohydrate ABC transporter permease [Bacillus sp. Y-01]KOP74586.1 ABC transporter permease [Bacillus sp. FJAT-21351]KQU22426.1 ABC transporter permease [Bacillus sp. Leaf75]MBZ5479833.1 carbohydrate ABC transporter permease [Bacillus sp. T_4]MCF6796279.1 carbohydrate ABC transporter permease [Bacillus sp. ET1]MDH6654604.1 raffinose/stachyose/melibiose transport system permease protein [Bacillus sp. PvP124]MDP957525
MQMPKTNVTLPNVVNTATKERKKKRYTGVTIVYVGLIIYFIVIAYPLLWMIISSFKSTDEIFTHSWSMPHTWLIENYVTAWKSGISSYFLNSVIVTGASCFLTVLVSALGAYGLSRFEFQGKAFVLIICLGGLMLSPQVSLIPLYSIIQKLGIYNTHLALILPYVAYRIPLTILLIRAYFLSIPKELEEAARLDGCTSFGILFRIFIPMSTPILLTTTILTAYYTWNEFMFAIIFIDDDSLRTIPAGLMQFRDALQTDWGVLLAGLTISAAPIVMLFLFMQKYFIRGIANGSVK